MARDELTLKIARIAHECWCKKMLEDGWKPGDEYCLETMTHDALRSFDELSPFDRDQAALCIESDEVEDLLARTLRLSRGSEREFTVAEMAVGLAVRSANIDDPTDSPTRGQIQSWEVKDAKTGRLSTIRVLWEDGSESVHVPSAEELARI